MANTAYNGQGQILLCCSVMLCSSMLEHLHGAETLPRASSAKLYLHRSPWEENSNVQRSAGLESTLAVNTGHVSKCHLAPKL